MDKELYEFVKKEFDSCWIISGEETTESDAGRLASSYIETLNPFARRNAIYGRVKKEMLEAIYELLNKKDYPTWYIEKMKKYK